MVDSVSESQTELKILNAAAQIFLEKGHDGARMQEIARKAGINKALLHYYFRSKEKLFQAVFQKELQAFFLEILRSIPESNEVEVFLRSFVRNYIQRLSRHPLLLRFILWEIQQGGRNFQEVSRKIMEELRMDKFPLLQKVEDLIQSEQMQPVDPIQFVFNLIGMCVFPFLARPLIETLFPTVKILSPKFLSDREQAIVDLILNGVLRHD